MTALSAMLTSSAMVSATAVLTLFALVCHEWVSIFRLEATSGKQVLRLAERSSKSFVGFGNICALCLEEQSQNIWGAFPGPRVSALEFRNCTAAGVINYGS